MIRTVFLFCLLFVATNVFAATDDWTVTQIIGDDSVAPTTPTSIVPVPVAATQIDVSWATSTDDQSLTGYRLFRDSVHIATTSLTSFSDTGLTPSTTYSYTVEAYDWFFNISSTSVAAATTTFALPVVPSTPSSTSTSNVGSQMSPRLVSLDIQPSQESALFKWDTNIYTKYVLRWGLSSEYDSGFIQSTVYNRAHETNLRNLQPGTQYMFELIGVNQLGREFLLEQGSFTTLDEVDVTAPSNVSDVRAVVENDSIFIQWNNPDDIDFQKVRVVRNHLFYPQDLADGFIVYEGDAQSVLDSGVLLNHPGQYYTIFAYDASGNISSGAVVFAYREGENITPGLDDSEDETLNEVEDTAQITFADVRFIQENEVLPQKDGQIVIDSQTPLGIQIPSELLQRNLKTIIVTLTDTYGDSQSYMLRSSNDKKNYQALLRSLTEGVYQTSFLIYDYQTQLQTTFSGQIVSQKWISSNDVEDDGYQSYSVAVHSLFTQFGLLLGSLSLLFIFWIWFLFKRSREDN